MKVSKFGEVILDEAEIIQGLYSGKISNLSNVNIDDAQLIEKFNLARAENADVFPSISLYQETKISIEEFDKFNQSSWFMPDSYKKMDIELFILEQCTTDIEFERVAEELLLFRQHGMIDLLKYLKYLVDTMRDNNIVWGVGRGSSLASYCLYLIGVHKIDSIKYQLDITEFLK